MSRTQEKINHTIHKNYAGIDVGKTYLDLYITGKELSLRVENTTSGIRKIIKHCKTQNVALTAIEATGKYHCLAHEKLYTAGLAIAVINPFRSRQFADSMGRYAKTDTIDAKTIAAFAERMKPNPTPPPTEQSKELRELHTARRQILQEITDLKRQMQTTAHKMVLRQMKARSAMLEKHKKAVETEIQSVINNDHAMRRKFEILTSIPGVGTQTATTLIADVSELGCVNARQIAALIGVAPMNWDSGAKHGNRMIRGGRKTARNALYMSAVCCASHKYPLGHFYRQLRKRGKCSKVALTAVMRKLAILANTLITQDRCWQPVSPEQL